MKAKTCFAVLVFALAAMSTKLSAQTPAEKGQQLFEAQKCSLCHSIAGKGNVKGALDGKGAKLTAAEIKSWLTDPAEMAKKTGATRKPPMKSFASLPAADLDALAAYILTLKK